jgi:UDP-N-acetylmuramate--alanine ligase
MKNCLLRAVPIKIFMKHNSKPLRTVMEMASDLYKLTNEDNVHFIGIGGAGMAPLAGILLEQGVRVTGSDLTVNEKTIALQKAGAKVFEGHFSENLSDDTSMLVYSSAVPEDNPEYRKAIASGISCLRRGEFLARLATGYKRCVAISGSHGKTTVTAMLAWIVRKCGIDCGYMIGGKVKGFSASAAGDGDIFITEVDESDGTHALIHPYLGIVTNVEDDHSWSVGGSEQLFRNFSKFASQSTTLFYVGDANSDRLFAGHPKKERLSEHELMTAVDIGFGGYLKLNAVLACRCAEFLGIAREEAFEAIRSFPGVDRRMTVHCESDSVTVVEDYAHHPTELAKAVELFRERWPGHHLRVVFQPHRYARLAKYLEGFAEELAKADSVFVVPVFAAWTENGPVKAEELVEKIGEKCTFLNREWSDMPECILKNKPSRPLLIAVLGAGDIDQLIPEIQKNI